MNDITIFLYEVGCERQKNPQNNKKKHGDEAAHITPTFMHTIVRLPCGWIKPVIVWRPQIWRPFQSPSEPPIEDRGAERCEKLQLWNQTTPIKLLHGEKKNCILARNWLVAATLAVKPCLFGGDLTLHFGLILDRVGPECVPALRGAQFRVTQVAQPTNCLCLCNVKGRWANSYSGCHLFKHPAALRVGELLLFPSLLGCCFFFFFSFVGSVI